MKVGSIITIGKGELSRREWERLFKALSFNDNDNNEVTAYDYVPGLDIVRMPRGAWSLLPEHVKVTRDNRIRPPMPKMTYSRNLDAKGYEGQEEAVRLMFEHGQGQIIAPPGRGKTEIGLAFAAAARTRTLVVVHTKDLMQQWNERIAASLPNCFVGKIQGQDCQPGHITVAMAQTLKRHLDNDELWQQFGAVLIDEAHHAAAETWEWLLNSCPAHYRFGLTATDKRADGRQALVNFNIGPVIYRIAFKSQVPLQVRPVGTKFRSTYSAMQYSKMLRQLVEDEERNALIAKVAVREYRRDNVVLVLSRQISHLEKIAEHIELAMGFDEGDLQRVAILTGRVPMGIRNKRVVDFRAGDIRIVLATQLADEGLDVPRLNRVLLTFPGKHDGRIIQQIGRAIRKFEGKQDAIVYDFVDEFVPKFREQYEERKRTYRKLSIKIGKAVKYGQGKGKRKRLKGADFIRALRVRRA